MNLKSNLRMPKETVILLILFVLGAYFFYRFSGLAPVKLSGAVFDATVTLNPTEQDMEKIKKGETVHAVKVEENGEYYLHVYGIYMNGEKIMGKYSLTKEQYDSINLNKSYWFEVKYKKVNDFAEGTIKKIYNYNPNQNSKMP